LVGLLAGLYKGYEFGHPFGLPQGMIHFASDSRQTLHSGFMHIDDNSHVSMVLYAI
jgi:hypothetical protein